LKAGSDRLPQPIALLLIRIRLSRDCWSFSFQRLPGSALDQPGWHVAVPAPTQCIQPGLLRQLRRQPDQGSNLRFAFGHGNTVDRPEVLECGQGPGIGSQLREPASALGRLGPFAAGDPGRLRSPAPGYRAAGGAGG